jgi:Bacterial protein of unknown function (DUF899)
MDCGPEGTAQRGCTGPQRILQGCRRPPFHTYSNYGRGLDPLFGTYMILDLVPKGRDEDRLAFTMEWVRYRDRYGTNEFADADKPYWPPTAASSAATCSCESTEAHA